MNGPQPPTKLWPQQPAPARQLPRPPAFVPVQALAPTQAEAQPSAPTQPLPQGYTPARSFHAAPPAPGPWPHDPGPGYPAPGQWPQAPAPYWPPAPGTPGPASGIPGQVARPGQGVAARPGTARRVPLLATLALVLLLVGGGVWALAAGHRPGNSADPGTASSAGPLAAPGLPAPRVPVPGSPAPGVAAGPIGGLVSGGGFCLAAADAVNSQTEALNDPNTDLAAMARTAKASNHKMASAAPAQLRGDFREFLAVSDPLADTMAGGRQMQPGTMLAVASPEFGVAVDHITDYLRTSCNVDFTSLASPGVGR